MNKADELLNQFDDGLRRLIVDYDIFLSGGRKTPPTNSRFRIEQIVKQLLEERISFSQRFRYNQLVAKYSVHKDLWRRQLQEKEERGALRSEKELKQLTQHVPPPEKEDTGYYAQSLHDPERQTAQVLRLYQELQSMRMKNGEKKLKIDVDHFRMMVQEKTQTIKEKQNCDSAEFIVSLDKETGKVRFLARPQTRPQSASPELGKTTPPSGK